MEQTAVSTQSPKNPFIFEQTRFKNTPLPVEWWYQDYDSGTGSNNPSRYHVVDMTSTTSSHSEVERIDQLLKGIVRLGIAIPNPGQVKKFLICHQTIIDLVALACQQTRQQFAPPSQLVLAIYQDPEYDEEHLELLVRQKQYVPDIMDRIELVCEKLRAIREDWFLSFFVTTDFLII